MVQTKPKKKVISIVSSMLLGLNLLLPSVSFANSSDIEGHWAQSQIQKWSDKGWAKGYEDGSFKPNNSITRAEFVSFINRFLGYKDKAQIQYSDVKADAWYADEIAVAVKNGYIKGYEDGTMRPNQQITRQETAAMVARIASLKMSASDAEKVLSQFKDQKDIPQWSKGAVGAVVSNKMMNGYPDHTYRPGKPITRAEAIVTLENLLANSALTVTFAKAGTFGSPDKTTTVDGNVIITSADVTLQNYVINGDLIIHERVADGNVALDKVTVKGTTVIRGGGSKSVYVKDSTLGTMNVNKKNGDVRIEASGATSIKKVNLESGAKLEEKGLTGGGFTEVSVLESTPNDSVIDLNGNLETLLINAPKTRVKLVDGTFLIVQVTEKAKDARIDLADEAIIKTLTLDAAMTVRGKGKIEVANINVNGSKFEREPKKVNMPEGVTYTLLTAGGGGGGVPSTPTNEQKLKDGQDVSGNVTLTGANQTYGGKDARHIATVTGDVTIKAENITLKNVKITGDLIISEKDAANVNLEEFTANNVEVEGETLIGGGSSHTVRFADTILSNVQINKPNVRLALDGNTSVSQSIEVNAPAILDLNTTGDLQNVAVKAPITLQGSGAIKGSFTVNEAVEINIFSDLIDLTTIIVNASNVVINIPEGMEDKITIEAAPGSNVTPPVPVVKPQEVVDATVAINNLPSLEKLTLGDEAKVKAARKLVDLAIQLEKILDENGISNIGILKALEERLNVLLPPKIESISYGGLEVKADSENIFKINLKDISNRINANFTTSKEGTLDLQFGNMSIKGIGVIEGTNRFSDINVGNLDISGLNEARVDFIKIFEILKDSKVDKQALYDLVHLEDVFGIIEKSDITQEQILGAMEIEKLKAAIKADPNVDHVVIGTALFNSEYEEFFRELNKANPETKALVLESIKFDELLTIIDNSNVDRVQIVRAMDLQGILRLVDDANDIGLAVFEILEAMDGDDSDLLNIHATLRDNNGQTEYTIQMQF